MPNILRELMKFYEYCLIIIKNVIINFKKLYFTIMFFELSISIEFFL